MLEQSAEEAERFARRCSVAHRYIAAVNGRDVDAILSLFAADAIVCDPVGRPDREFQGRDHLRRFYEGVVQRANLELTGPIRGGYGDTIACEVRAAIPGYEIDVITLTAFNADGLISDYRAFWGPRNIRPASAGM